MKLFAHLSEDRKRRMKLECGIAALVTPLLFVLVAAAKVKSGVPAPTSSTLLWGLLAGCLVQSSVLATCLWGAGSRRLALASIAWASATMGMYVLSRIV